MNAPVQSPAKASALFVITDPTLVRRNNLVGKLRALGLLVTREITADAVRRVDTKGVDAVIALADGLRFSQRDAVKAAAGDAPLFWIGHQTTGPGWLTLGEWLAKRPHVRSAQDRVIELQLNTGAPAVTSGKLSIGADNGASVISLPPRVSNDFERLAEAYAAENDQLRDAIAKLRADLADAPKAVATIARLESERTSLAKTVEEQAAALKRITKERGDLETLVSDQRDLLVEVRADLDAAENRMQGLERELGELRPAPPRERLSAPERRAERIIAAVRSQPGIGTAAICERVGVGNRSITALVTVGRLVVRQQKGSTLHAHYVPEAAPPEAEPEPEAKTAAPVSELATLFAKLVEIGEMSPTEAFLRLSKAARS
jgi:hypothetical protein